MTDDRTIQLSELLPIIVRVEKGLIKEREHRFTTTVRVGRSTECNLQLLDRSVSKLHMEIRFEGRQWWIHDLQSRNGTFLNGTRVEREPLGEVNRLELGRGGPILDVTVEALADLRERSPVDSSSASFVRIDSSKDNSSLGVAPEPEVPRPIDPPDDLERRIALAEKAAQAAEARRLKPTDRESIPESQRNSELLERFEDEAEMPSSVEQPSSETPSQPVSDVGSEPVSDPSPPEQASMTQIIRSALDRRSGEGAGERTIMIKRTFDDVFKRRSRKYQMAVALGLCLSLILAGVAWYQTSKMAHLRVMASDLFYSMKTLELELANLEDMVLRELSPTQVENMLKRKKNLELARQRTAQEYEKFLEDIGIYSPTMPPQDRLILRMARLFGESEVEMPEEFVQEVKRYIRKWQSTNALAKAIARANKHHYGDSVAKAMLAEHMPPQFFYLGLKESAFNLKAVGPKTRFGIAKGPWQFIPTTAVEYGLQTGPLVDIERYDPRDDRHNFQKATRAAAKYLRYLYTTEAQASGLLVMASYNWGPTRVKKLIRKLSPNPRDRNFWQLMKQFQIPQQTKDYVLYIFSATVIGQDPELFGFQFPAPLPESMFSSSD
ncbi:MAG: hypothetical protein NPIRA01_08330 [Nitrospirales bacterium]|nr:MAG: hypothetical protein NPIRA01_08330 [Nitrospirales bacterium]